MTMLNSLYSIPVIGGSPSSRYPLSLGIEVELEGIRFVANEDVDYDDEDDDEDRYDRYGAPIYLRDFWNLHQDGSLRNGIEFSFNEPLMGDAVERAVDDLFRGLDTFDPNPRCSTHIHVGANGLSVENLQAFVALMGAVEEGIYNMVTPDRKWCGYAMPISSMSNTRLANIFSQDADVMMEALDSRARRQERYYGCNLLSLRKFGTIEFRYFQGVSTRAELLKWADLVTQLMSAARSLSWSQLAAAVNDPLALDSLLSNFFGAFYAEISPQLNRQEVVETLENMLALTEQVTSLDRQGSPLMFYSPVLVKFCANMYQMDEAGREKFDAWFKAYRAVSIPDLRYYASLHESTARTTPDLMNSISVENVRTYTERAEEFNAIPPLRLNRSARQATPRISNPFEQAARTAGMSSEQWRNYVYDDNIFAPISTGDES